MGITKDYKFNQYLDYKNCMADSKGLESENSPCFPAPHWSSSTHFTITFLLKSVGFQLIFITTYYPF